MTAHHCVAYPCPVCNANYSPHYTLPPAPVFHPPGCICPPTSEQTCQAPMCPRKGIKFGSVSQSQ